MADYIIYKYLFNRSDDKSLFSKLTKEDAVNQAQEELEKAVKGELFFVKAHRNRDNDYDRLSYKLLGQKGGISVLLINNVKRRNYQEGKEELTLEYHPGCYVVIDNRPGIAQIAIEKARAFDYDTDLIMRLLKRALDRALGDIGLSIDIQPKYRPVDFWDTVEEISKKRKDRVKQIVFRFSTENTIGPLEASEAEMMKMSFLTSLLTAFDGAEGVFGIKSKENKSLTLDRTRQDAAFVIDMCSRNGYEIAVHFQKSGVFRTDKEVQLMRTLDDAFILSFTRGEMDMFNGCGHLGVWLDDIHETILVDEEKALEGGR